MLTGMMEWLAFGQSADSLNHYLKIAGENNPAVKAAFLQYEASLQKAPQMGAYDDPQLEMGFFLEPMDIVGGREIARFQLMQMFPWFGTRKAARTEAQQMAKMAFEAFREARDNLYLEVYTQWYILCSLQQKRINSEANRDLLQQLEALALRKYSSGGSFSGDKRPPSEDKKQKTAEGTGNPSMPGMNMGGVSPSGNGGNGEDMGSMSMSGASSGMSEVLRIQLEIMELESNIEGVLSEIKAGKARFNALLNRPPESEVVVPDEFPPLIYRFDRETSLQNIERQNPMLGMINEEVSAYKAKLEMEKKMSYPMFGIGLQYMLTGKTPESGMSSMSSMNGKDMWMPMISVSLPIFRNKYKAAQKESKLLRQAGEAQYANTRNTLEAALYQSKHQMDEAQRKIILYGKQSEVAHTTYDLVVKEFTSGKSDLSAVLQVQRQLLDYQLKKAEAVAAYNTAVANMQKITAQWNDLSPPPPPHKGGGAASAVL
jgi:outer membrane protein TolC